jgi:hypothetical protein
MRSSSDKDSSDRTSPALGFLTVCDLGELGLVGGYLLLNLAGRPIEFHCTAPVRATRAQEILYGPTLAPFLYGEQIGRALVEKTSILPQAVIADCDALLAVQSFTTAPVLLLSSAATNASGLQTLQIGEQRLLATAEAAGDGRLAAELAEATIEFAEPFERIREAIREAQRDALQRQERAAEAA